MLDTVFIAFNVCVAFVLPTGGKGFFPLECQRQRYGRGFSRGGHKKETDQTPSTLFLETASGEGHVRSVCRRNNDNKRKVWGYTVSKLNNTTSVLPNKCSVFLL